MQILAADIGGTSSRFAAFSFDNDSEPQQVASVWLKTSDADSFASLLGLLASSEFPLSISDADLCVFAVAGPVREGVFCDPPNIDWEIDLTDAEKCFGLARFLLINDFLAQAFVCRSPIGKNATQILKGRAVPNSAIATIGAGTGLGKAVLVPDGAGDFIAAGSEGGHAAFAAESQREFEFVEFVRKQTGSSYVIWEDVVSGRGLSRIHHFLSGDELTPEKVSELLGEDLETTQWAARFYGRACRDYLLDVLALGGVYIAGGVAAKNPQLIQHSAFEEAFRKSSTHEKLLQNVPVFLIDDQQSGLWGAAYCGWSALRKGTI